MPAHVEFAALLLDRARALLQFVFRKSFRCARPCAAGSAGANGNLSRRARSSVPRQISLPLRAGAAISGMNTGRATAVSSSSAALDLSSSAASAASAACRRLAFFGPHRLRGNRLPPAQLVRFHALAHSFLLPLLPPGRPARLQPSDRIELFHRPAHQGVRSGKGKWRGEEKRRKQRGQSHDVRSHGVECVLQPRGHQAAHEAARRNRPAHIGNAPQAQQRRQAKASAARNRSGCQLPNRGAGCETSARPAPKFPSAAETPHSPAPETSSRRYTRPPARPNFAPHAPAALARTR